MKRLKIFAIAIATILFTSCEEDFPSREDSPFESESSMKVQFANNDTSYVLGENDESFFIELYREIPTSTATINLHSTSSDYLFDIPSTASFNAGETKTTIEVKLKKDIEMFKKYTLYVNLDLTPEQSNFYDSLATAPQLVTTITKEDYKPYGIGTFTSWLFGDWDNQIIEYSEYKDAYRLTNLITVGYDLEFKLNADKTAFKVISGDDAGDNTIEWETGIDKGYGMICAYFYPQTTQDESDYYHGTFENNTFTFLTCEYYDTDSWGEGTETFSIDQKY